MSAGPKLGKTHKPAAPTMTDDMRAWMTEVLDDEYNRGRAEGVKAALKGRVMGELGMFFLGIVTTGIGLFFWFRIWA